MSATCAGTRERLDDYVDGLLQEDERDSVAHHLLSCEGCRAEEAQLRALLAEAAALPREVSPPAHLWPRIERRIRPQASGAWLRHLAAAACVALAVGAAIVVRAPRREAAGAGTGVAQPAALAPADMAQVERDYERAAAALLVQVRSRRDEMPAETLAQVEESLRTIDLALEQIRTALREQPDEPALHLMLAATHRKKVEVLRRVMEVGA
jgi:anti-sigma factor RsiW